MNATTTTRTTPRESTARRRRLLVVVALVVLAALVVCVGAIAATAAVRAGHALSDRRETTRLEDAWGIPLDGGSLVADAQEKDGFHGDGVGYDVYAFPGRVPPDLTRPVTSEFVDAREVVREVRTTLPGVPAPTMKECALIRSDYRGHLVACVHQDAPGAPSRLTLYESVI